MTPNLSGGGGGGYDYVQDSQPADPEIGESWFDTGAGSAFVWDGSAWVEQTVVDHGQLGGVSAADHHTRFGDDASDSVADIPNRDHGDLTGVSADDHHVRPDSLTDLSSADHGDLSGVDSSDHHVRFGEDANDSVADIPDRDHSDLTGVSADDHHTRPTDTQSTQATSGRQAGEVLVGELTTALHVYSHWTELRASGTADLHDQVTVTFVDGSTETPISSDEMSQDQSSWFGVTATKTIYSISTGSDKGNIVVDGLNMVLAPSHGHNI